MSSLCEGLGHLMDANVCDPAPNATGQKVLDAVACQNSQRLQYTTRWHLQIQSMPVTHANWETVQLELSSDFPASRVCVYRGSLQCRKQWKIWPVLACEIP